MDTMKTILSKHINVGGHNIHYYVGGEGEPLIIVHGGLGDARTWLNNMEKLIPNYTVYIPDLPGFGDSDSMDEDDNVILLTNFIEEFAQALKLDNFYLVGHSIGGGVALNYSLKFPGRVKKLVLVSSLCLGNEIALWVRITSFAARCIGPALIHIEKAAEWLFSTLLHTIKFILPVPRGSVELGRNITDFQKQTLVLSDRLEELLSPTLLIWGNRDEIVPVRHAYAAADIIPDCELKVFNNRGHDIHRQEINEFSHLITNFLA